VNPHHGTPVNPWAPDRAPGGSSSGSAVAVASGIAAAAVGTDAGGSVRIPAALNGLVGLKPTRGAVPLEGVAQLTHDLDHVGPIAWTVDDAATLFEVMAAVALDRDAAVGRVALLPDVFAGLDEAVTAPVLAAAAEVFGACPEIATPLTAWSVQVAFVVAGTEAAERFGALAASGALAPDTRVTLRLAEGLGDEDRRRAARAREGIRAELDLALRGHDVLIAPATGAAAPRVHPAARRTGELDLATVARLAAPCFPANLTGLPALTVPCVREGLPVGMQLVGRRGEEARLLAAARAVEARFGPRRPPRWHG
jgi:Asp-tRNA(Asn)/Glu-tRNA(Gln) amidotransferase A subunit family amidase